VSVAATVLLAAALGACGGGGSANTPPDTTPPTAPTNLLASSASSTQINLSWTASTDNVGVTGYRVERCQGAGCSNFTQIATPTGTSFNDTGLTPSTSYSYRVRAADAAGNLSGYSNTASATTQASTSAATPSCQNINDQLEPYNQFAGSSGYLRFYLPRPAGAGNTIIVGATASNGTTITVADDQSDSYSVAASEEDSNNFNHWNYLFYASNVSAGARQIQVSYSPGDPYVAAWAMECTNVGALDVNNGNIGTGTTVTAGSITPTATGDLLVQFSVNNSVTPNNSVASWTVGSQSNITWQFAVADRGSAAAAQWGVYNSTSSINPTMTVGTAGFASVVAAFKAAAAGTSFPATGIQIDATKTFWISTGAGSNFNSLPRTENFACPASDNAMIIQWIGINNGGLSGVSDSNGNTWNNTGAEFNPANGGGAVITWYAQAATVSPSQTLTLSGSPDNDSAKAYCVRGASTTSFFDKTATNVGSQSSAGNLTAVSITPSTSNGLVMGYVGVSSDTMIGVTGAGQLFQSCFWSQESSGFGGCDENNGWASYLNPNTSTVTFTFTEQFGDAANGWVARADAFEAAVVSGSQPVPSTDLTATSIVAPVPGGATTGNIVVTVEGQASNGLTFSVTTTSQGEPTLLQHVIGSNTRGNALDSPYRYTQVLPDRAAHRPESESRGNRIHAIERMPYAF
jgi:Fibronectin type III domain